MVDLTDKSFPYSVQIASKYRNTVTRHFRQIIIKCQQQLNTHTHTE